MKDTVGFVGDKVGDVAGGVKDLAGKAVDKVEDGVSTGAKWWEKFFKDEEKEKEPEPIQGTSPIVRDHRTVTVRDHRDDDRSLFDELRDRVRDHRDDDRSVWDVLRDRTRDHRSGEIEVRDHRDEARGSVEVRDHRDEARGSVEVRDHRDEARGSVEVRDHRDEARGSVEVRDHRDERGTGEVHGDQGRGPENRPPHPPHSRRHEALAYVSMILEQNSVDRGFMQGFEAMVTGQGFGRLHIEIRLDAVGTLDYMHRNGAAAEELTNVAGTVNDAAFAGLDRADQRATLADFRLSMRGGQQAFRDQLMASFAG